MKKNADGFTLIELLVVIAIIGILSTIAMTSLNGARKKAYDASFQSSAKSVVAVAILCCDTLGATLLEGAIGDEDYICSDSTLGTYSKNLGHAVVDSNCGAPTGWRIDVDSLDKGTLDHAECTEAGCNFM